MSVHAAPHIATPLPTPLFSLSATPPRSHLPNISSNAPTPVPLDFMLAGMNDNDSPPDHPGFTDPDASPSPAARPTQTFTVVVTLTPSPQDATSATSGLAIPTKYLSQVPREWPYTKFGVGRRREIATWDLTDGEGETAGVVKHEVRWLPRPLRTGEEMGEWRPTFVISGRESVDTGGGKTREMMDRVVTPVETKGG